jgi:transcriptional regulator with XRE-family HTH domain
MSTFSDRLREARLEAGLSQEQLGVLIGIDEASASSRMNHYEKDRHEPDFSLVERIAKALNIPESYLYAKDDDMALLLLKFHRMNMTSRNEVMRYVKGL